MRSGLELVATSRPTFSPGLATLTFTVPTQAKKGDLLLALIVSDATEATFTTPVGWAVLDDVGASEAKLATLARLVDDAEPSSVVVALTGATKERQGQLLVLRGGSPNVVLEAAASSTFSASSSPPAPTAAAAQAINLAIAVWSSSGSPALTVPLDGNGFPEDGYSTIDNYATALATARSVLFAYRQVGATGDHTPPEADASVAATGRAWTKILRDRPPYRPGELVDPVPGNLGLLP